MISEWFNQKLKSNFQKEKLSLEEKLVSCDMVKIHIKKAQFI